MAYPLVYRLTHSTGSVDLSVTAERFVLKTQGTGLADRPRTVDIAIADLKYFCLTPTTRAQTPSDAALIDAEFIFSFVVAGKSTKRRFFVAAADPAMRELVSALRELRPDASLLELAPREAYRKVGVLSPQQGARVVLAVIFGLPLVGLLVWLALQILAR